MLTKCIQCGFNILSSDTFCPNCGLGEPSVDYADQHRSLTNKLHTIGRLISGPPILVIPVIVIACLLILFVTYIVFPLFYYRYSSLLWLAMFAAVVTYFAIYIFAAPLLELAIKDLKKGPEREVSRDSLEAKYVQANKRLYELKSRSSRLDRLINEIRESPTEKLLEAESSLVYAREHIGEKLERYELQKKRIGLIREGNRLLPFVYGMDELNDAQTENAIITVREILDALEETAQSVSDESPFPDAERERQHFLAQLDETERGIATIRESLLARQAAFTLSSIRKADSDHKLQLESAELARNSDIFNIQTSLTDFSESFDRLEAEYLRLEADVETEKKLLG